MGEMYSDGEGVDPDPEEGFRWFLEAARAGDATAQYSLSQCYLRGAGHPVDLREAERWLTKAVEAGDPRAPAALAQLRATLRGPAGGGELGNDSSTSLAVRAQLEG